MLPAIVFYRTRLVASSLRACIRCAYVLRMCAAAVAMAGLGVVLGMGLAGCRSTSPLSKPASAYSKATTMVVEKSEDAYQAANKLYFDEQVSEATLNYEKQTNWDPRSIKPLLTSRQLATRTNLLDALKTYAEDVSTVANAKGGTELNTASAAVGNNLLEISTNLSTDLGGANGVKLTHDQANYLSTAVNALGRALIARKVHHDLPPLIISTDPAIRAICDVLQRDIGLLEEQSTNDYSNLLTLQDQFVRDSFSKLSPEERRAEIRRLPLISQKMQASKDLLEGLKASIGKMAAAHHALADAAQGGSPETLDMRIADLAASAQSLAAFYQSLPTS